jgi:hypothetical protein
LLSDLNDEPDAAEQVNLALEESKSAFHWARQKAQKKDRTITVPVDENPAPVATGWRARAMMKEDRSREMSIGSSSAFPALGGAKAAADAPAKPAGGSIWSQFQTDDTDEVRPIILPVCAPPFKSLLCFLAQDEEDEQEESSEAPDTATDAQAAAAEGPAEGGEPAQGAEGGANAGAKKEGDTAEDAERFAGLKKKKKKKKAFESEES